MPVNSSRSQKFRHLRTVHHREKAEDYVEMIQELVAKQGEARLTDVAKRFGVTTVTAHKILSRLQRENLIVSKPYRALFLTDKGKQLATRSHHRHEIVYRFLRKLGVPDDIAQVDAEGIEHHVSPKTLSIMKRAVKIILVLALFWNAPLSAHHRSGGNTPKPIVTDRPDRAESSQTVDKHHFQIETSFAYAQDRDARVTTRTYSFPTLIRFGLLESFELRLEGETFAIQTQTGAGTQKGFTDLAVGFKEHLVDKDRWIPSLGLLAHLNIPTGKSSFSSNAAEPIMKIMSDWELPADFSFGTNVGFDVPVRDATGDKFARFLYAATVGHPFVWLADRMNFFVELAGAVPIKENKSDQHTFDTGLTLRLGDRMQLDTSVQIGLTNATNDFATGLGFSIKL